MTSLDLLRRAALLVVLAAAAASLALTIYAGRHNSSRLLLILFGIWVLFPFAALVVAGVPAKRWPVIAQTTIYVVMLLIAVGSVVIYGVWALGPPRRTSAFVFVVLPPISSLLIAAVLPLALIAGMRSRARGAASRQ